MLSAIQLSIGFTIFLLFIGALIKVLYFVMDWYYIEKPRRAQERKRILECLDS